MTIILDAEHYLSGMEQIAHEAERRVRNWAYTDDGTDEAMKANVRKALERCLRAK